MKWIWSFVVGLGALALLFAIVVPSFLRFVKRSRSVPEPVAQAAEPEHTSRDGRVARTGVYGLAGPPSASVQGSSGIYIDNELEAEVEKNRAVIGVGGRGKLQPQNALSRPDPRVQGILGRLQEGARFSSLYPEGDGLMGKHEGTNIGSLYRRGEALGEVVELPYPLERARIDPNGRFATTYRPGRADLLRATSLMAHGMLPEALRGVVADLGAGHAEPLAPPIDRALALEVDTDRALLPPDGGSVHLRLRLRGAEQAPARPTLAVTLVLDVSGSMNGPPLDAVKRAAHRLVEKLEPGDRVAVVTYESEAHLVLAEGVLGPRRARVLAAIDALDTAGGTNLEAGLALGYAQARRAPDQADVVRLVVVMSDGLPNAGETSAFELTAQAVRAFQDGIETTAIGVGSQYDASLMRALAEQGAGGYYYLPDARQMEDVLRREIDVRTRPVARAVEIRIRLARGVQLLETYGSRRLGELEASRVRVQEVAADQRAAAREGIATDRQRDAHGGMRFFIPSFARGDAHTMLLELAVAGAPREGALAHIELRYKDRRAARNRTEERAVRYRLASDAALSASSERTDVRRTVLAFKAGAELLHASHAGFRDRATAAARLVERARLLRAGAERLGDETLRREAALLEQCAKLLDGRAPHQGELELAMLLGRSGEGMMR